MARPSMAGTRVFCPSCRRELSIPPTGQAVDETQYLKGERYAIVCSCGCRMLVKAEAADHTIHCPECAGAVRVPNLAKLRSGKTPALVSRKPSREYIDTQDLILLVDDKEGPGAEIV
jgi:hypothetical protein